MQCIYLTPVKLCVLIDIHAAEDRRLNKVLSYRALVMQERHTRLTYTIAELAAHLRNPPEPRKSFFYALAHVTSYARHANLRKALFAGALAARTHLAARCCSI